MKGYFSVFIGFELSLWMGLSCDFFCKLVCGAREVALKFSDKVRVVNSFGDIVRVERDDEGGGGEGEVLLFG